MSISYLVGVSYDTKVQRRMIQTLTRFEPMYSASISVVELEYHWRKNTWEQAVEIIAQVGALLKKCKALQQYW